MPDSPPAGCPIVYTEIPAPDLDAGQRFYETVFGWQFTPSGPDYRMFRAGNGDGGLSEAGQPCDHGVTVTIQVDDIPDALARVAEHGGSVLAGKTKISDELGFYAVFRDPNGNRLAVWSQT